MQHFEVFFFFLLFLNNRHEIIAAAFCQNHYRNSQNNYSNL